MDKDKRGMIIYALIGVVILLFVSYVVVRAVMGA
ncbi:hypothetical protein HAPAU_25780 [Halalkalicoccus paucihalophilus]|jgi:hypothetical protein|uniref:Uncharacterized protein n=1 Tax=Halalkalicoccus paucihalophilus TaxID=1008153 RepID=A0A151AEA0_9EURY|nr:hypothetical protein HAPAU_25780 [Halalkalicoccus paucihalophilus]